MDELNGPEKVVAWIMILLILVFGIAAASGLVYLLFSIGNWIGNL